MKTLGWAVGMLLVGYVLGGWGPRGELLDLEVELAEIREKWAHQKKGSRSALGGVTHVLNLPEDLAEKKASTPVRQAAGLEEDLAPAVKANPDKPSQISTNQPVTLKKQLDVAADAWAIRSELAMNAFVEKVKLDEPEAVRFEVLVEAMNLRIENTIVDMVEELSTDPRIAGEELGLRLIHEISEIMVLTYDELDRNMPADWREETGEKFTLSDLIDPHVALPLVDLEDRLDLN